jgi:hypothetical protein
LVSVVLVISALVIAALAMAVLVSPAPSGQWRSFQNSEEFQKHIEAMAGPEATVGGLTTANAQRLLRVRA